MKQLLHPQTPDEVWPTQAATRCFDYSFMREPEAATCLCFQSLFVSSSFFWTALCTERKSNPLAGTSPSTAGVCVKLLSSSLHGFHSTIKWPGYSRATLHCYLHTTSSQSKEERALQKWVPQWTALHKKWDEMKKIVPAKEKGNATGGEVSDEAQRNLLDTMILEERIQ